MVRALVGDGSTVLLTTQYLEEADALADEITVIDHGQVIAHDTPDAAQAHRRRPDARGAAGRPGAPGRPSRAILAGISGAPVESPRPRRAAVPVDDDEALARDACARLADGRHRRHRALPAPAEPRRGLLHPDRPHRGRPTTPTKQGGGGMTTALDSRRRPAGASAARPSTPAVRAWSGTALALARRSLIKTWRTPEAADRRHAAAGHVPGHLRLPLRRRRRRLHATTTCSSCCRRMLVQTIAVRLDRDRRQPQHRHQEGRLRPVPQPADRPVRAADRRACSATCPVRGRRSW